MNNFRIALRRRWRCVVSIGLGIACHGTAIGQLFWGEGGNGGSGTWDTTADQWWNGSETVAWTTGGTAVFSGIGGTVTSVFPGPRVKSITFDAPGYTIQDGWIEGPSIGAGFKITTNQPATIGSLLNGSAVIKEGAASLTVSGTVFADLVSVRSGEYIVAGSSSLFFSDVLIADVPGAIVTLSQTSDHTNIHSLSGGGLSGGILQPDDRARTVTAQIWDTGTFHGVMQDNGAGKLALEIFANSDVVALAGTNTYSGATEVQSGTFSLIENGSVLNSAITVNRSGTLQIDNSTNALANRVSDTQDLTLISGQVQIIGHNTVAVEEHLGELVYSGSAKVSNMRSGAADSLLTFAGATRSNRATISFSGSGRTKWEGMSNGESGIIGAFATVDDEWATTGADGRVDPLTSYVSDLNGAAATDHIKISGGGTSLLTGSAVRRTLNLQNDSAVDGLIQISPGQVLTLADGGLLSSGTTSNLVEGGTLRSAITELVVTNRTALTIASEIGESGPGTALVKSGVGILTLTGQNTYSGNTVINEGILVVGSDANLGTGAEVQFNGGTLRAAQSFHSTKSITHGTSWSPTIDTAGHDVTFTGTISAISKSGEGSLTLTNPTIGSASVSDGILRLTHGESGRVSLLGGTLEVSGELSSLHAQGGTTLDIGGASAATLEIGSLYLDSHRLSPDEEITIRFDLGSNEHDLWIVSQPIFLLSSESILFDFHNLGGAEIGTVYTLIDAHFVNLSFSNPLFGIAPTAVAAGWDGVFHVDSESVRFELTAVPEPGALLLLLCGALSLAFIRAMAVRTRATRAERD